MDFVSGLESPARTLFRRCVRCPDQQPSCGTCKAGYVCSLIAETCDACASTQCVAKASVSGAQETATPKPKSTSAGPVAGGVIGGVVAIALVTFLVWRFCVKNRKRHEPQQEWVEENNGSEKYGMDQFSTHRSNRASTHTVGSLASTVYTRASNIIQIAYIPGVTNRSDHSSPDLIPPVPPIPAASTPGSTLNSPHGNSEDQHFFLPSDLRESTYTDRNSLASTVYRNNAIVSPVPAQTITRGKATSVSVRSNKNSPAISRSTTPPLPSSASTPKTLNTQSSIVGRMGQPRPVQITRKGSSPQAPIYELDGSGSEASFSPQLGVPDRKYGNASPQYSHHSSAFEEGSSDEEYGSHNGRGAGGRRLLGKNRQSESTTIQGSPISPAELSTFSRESQNLENLNIKGRTKRSTSLNQIIEEATRNASRDPLHGGLGSYEHQEHHPELSPFSDSHATRTP